MVVPNDNPQNEVRLPDGSLSEFAEEYADREATIEVSGNYRPIYDILDELFDVTPVI